MNKRLHQCHQKKQRLPIRKRQITNRSEGGTNKLQTHAMNEKETANSKSRTIR